MTGRGRRVDFASARCGRSIRAVGWDVMVGRDPGLPSFCIASIDLWWWCARLMVRGRTPAPPASDPASS